MTVIDTCNYYILHRQALYNRSKYNTLYKRISRISNHLFEFFATTTKL